MTRTPAKIRPIHGTPAPLAPRVVEITPAPDPIFAAISACKTAWDVFEHVCDVTDDARFPNRPKAQLAVADGIYESAHAAWKSEMERVCRITPATTRGLLALAEFLAEEEQKGIVKGFKRDLWDMPVHVIVQTCRSMFSK